MKKNNPYCMQVLWPDDCYLRRSAGIYRGHIWANLKMECFVQIPELSENIWKVVRNFLRTSDIFYLQVRM